MPDTPLADRDGGPYDPPLERRVARLEEDGRQVIAAITRLEEPIARLETRGDRLDGSTALTQRSMVSMPRVSGWN